MPVKIYRIKLSKEEHIHLESIRDKDSHKATKYKRAVTLLLADEGDYGDSNKDSIISDVTGGMNRAHR